MPSSAVVLDTNVFVAAGFNPRSASAKIVDAVKRGRLRMVWNDATRREIERIMQQIPRLRTHSVSEIFRPEDRYAAAHALDVDARLRLLRRFPFRPAGKAVLGGRLFGIQRYRLVGLDLRSGRRRTLATLPDPDVGDLVAVPGAPALRVEPRAPSVNGAA